MAVRVEQIDERRRAGRVGLAAGVEIDGYGTVRPALAEVANPTAGHRVGAPVEGSDVVAHEVGVRDAIDVEEDHVPLASVRRSDVARRGKGQGRAD